MNSLIIVHMAFVCFVQDSCQRDTTALQMKMNLGFIHLNFWREHDSRRRRRRNSNVTPRKIVYKHHKSFTTWCQRIIYCSRTLETGRWRKKKNSQTQSSDACTIVQNEKKNDPEKCHINDDEHQQNGNKIKLNWEFKQQQSSGQCCLLQENVARNWLTVSDKKCLVVFAHHRLKHLHSESVFFSVQVADLYCGLNQWILSHMHYN